MISIGDVVSYNGYDSAQLTSSTAPLKYFPPLVLPMTMGQWRSFILPVDNNTDIVYYWVRRTDVMTLL